MTQHTALSKKIMDDFDAYCKKNASRASKKKRNLRS